MSESPSDLEELVRAYAAALAQEMQARLHKHLIAEALRHGFELPTLAPSSDTPASAQTPPIAPVPRSK